jgi:hypothetical protein
MRNQAVQKAGKGRFAGAVGAEDDGIVAVVNLKIQILEDPVAAGVAVGDPL